MVETENMIILTPSENKYDPGEQAEELAGALRDDQITWVQFLTAISYLSGKPDNSLARSITTPSCSVPPSTLPQTVAPASRLPLYGNCGDIGTFLSEDCKTGT